LISFDVTPCVSGVARDKSEVNPESKRLVARITDGKNPTAKAPAPAVLIKFLLLVFMTIVLGSKHNL
jgi:hypothetical protein